MNDLKARQNRLLFAMFTIAALGGGGIYWGIEQGKLCFESLDQHRTDSGEIVLTTTPRSEIECSPFITFD